MSDQEGFVREIISRIIATSLFSIAILWPVLATADGALAVGIPADVSKQGSAYGISYNEPTTNAASSAAQQNCKTMQNSSDLARSICKVINTFRNQCVAVSEDPQAGTPGYGWAIAADLQTAENQTLSKCRATAGENRRRFCGITMFGCDGSAR